MPIKLGPGRNSTIANLLAYGTNDNYSCYCAQERANSFKTSTNDPTQTKAERLSQLSRAAGLGGTVSFVNNIGSPTINSFGRTFGQPGGSGAPLRNRF